MAEDQLTLRMRTAGARTTKRDVDDTGRSVKKLGDNTKHAAEQSGAFSRATGLLTRPIHHLRSEVGGLAKSFIGMGLAFGSVEGIHKSIETTDELVKTTVQLKNQFGLTTESASGLAGVLAARNLAPQGLRMGLISLSKQMQAVTNGNDKAAEAFNYVGVSADDIRAALASPDGLEHIFARVTSAMTELPGGANKAAYGQLLLGRASKSLAPLLQEGALGLEQQLKWAKEYGVTLDGHTVGSVEEMAAAQTKAQYAALGLQIQLGQFLAPALTTVNETFADVVGSFRDGHAEGNKYSRTIYKIGTDLEPVGQELKQVGQYLADHPKLLRAAAIGFIAYKTKLLGLLLMAPKAYVQGLITGRAFSRGVATGAAEGEGATALAGAGRLGGGIFARAFLPAAAGIIGYELVDYLRKDPGHWMEHTHNVLKDAVNFVSPHTIAPAPTRRQVTEAVAGAVPGTRQYDAAHYHGFSNTSATGVGPRRRYSPDDASRITFGRMSAGQLAGLIRRDERLGTPAAAHQIALIEQVLRKQGHTVIDNHITVELDGKVVATSTHRQAVKAKSKR